MRSTSTTSTSARCCRSRARCESRWIGSACASGQPGRPTRPRSSACWTSSGSSRASASADLRDGLLELVDAERAFEALDDLAGLVDHERPRLGLQPIGGELRADPLVRVVVDVDLVVDEGHVTLRLGLHLLDDVLDRTAHAALAQLRGGEDEDHRLLAKDVV